MNLKINNVYQIIFVIISATLIAYAFFNTRFLLNGPEVTINNVDAKTNTIESLTKDFILEGVALHSSYISINQNAISVDEGGEFKQTLLLSEKINPIHIIARDRLGKEKVMRLTVIYTGDEKEPTFEEIFSSMLKKEDGTPSLENDTIKTSEEF